MKVYMAMRHPGAQKRLYQKSIWAYEKETLGLYTCALERKTSTDLDGSAVLEMSCTQDRMRKIYKSHPKQISIYNFAFSLPCL